MAAYPAPYRDLLLSTWDEGWTLFAPLRVGGDVVSLGARSQMHRSALAVEAHCMNQLGRMYKTDPLSVW